MSDRDLTKEWKISQENEKSLISWFSQ